MLRLLLNVLFAFFIITSSVQATVMTMAEAEVNNTTYKVMTMYGTFNEMQDDLRSQVWWSDDSSLAEDFAIAFEALGFPNQGDGPYFAYEQDFQSVSAMTCLAAPCGISTLSVQPLQPDIEYYYAKVVAQVVPIPAAAWLFMSGLIGLVWKGRKARQSV